MKCAQFQTVRRSGTIYIRFVGFLCFDGNCPAPPKIMPRMKYQVRLGASAILIAIPVIRTADDDDDGEEEEEGE